MTTAQVRGGLRRLARPATARPIERLHGVKENLQLTLQRLHMKARSRPRIAYLGALPSTNLGDMSVFRALQSGGRLQHLHPIQYIRREERFKPLGLSGSQFFDAVIVGGGTVGNWYWEPLLKYMADSGVPLSFHGTGFGSAGFDMSAEWSAGAGITEVLRRSRFVGVRGPLSLQRVREAGRSEAEIVGDTALLYAGERRSQPLRSHQILVNIAVSHSRIGPRNADDLAIFDIVSRCCRVLIEQGYSLLPVAMDPSDVAPLSDLLSPLHGDISEIVLPRSPEEFLGLATACRAAVAVRLHVGVLASCVGVPTALVAYRDKTLDFLESMSVPELALPLHSPRDSDALDAVSYMLQNADEYGGSVWSRAHHWRKLQLARLASLGLGT